MIVQNVELQCLECTDCGGAVELRRSSAGDPERVLLLQEAMAVDHRNCAGYGGDAAAAGRSAAFDRSVRAEMQRGSKR